MSEIGAARPVRIRSTAAATPSGSLTADDLLWNWARWTWSGETVGNMVRYVPWEHEDGRPIIVDHARRVDALHRRLPHHERMIVIAEYPQKNVMFADLEAHERREAARRWIAEVTGVHLTDHHYRLYLGLFKHVVEREML